jgi:hypothetical protein
MILFVSISMFWVVWHIPIYDKWDNAVLSNVFIYWGASDRWLWRRGRRVAIAIIIIIIIIK